MTTDVDVPTRILDRDQCLALLASTRLGRVALTDQALPVVLPVMYRVTPDAIEFEANGRMLSAAAHGGHVVCFEADDADLDTGVGWSVMVIGQLVVASAGPVAAAHPWLANGRGATMRLPTTIVTGRAIGNGVAGNGIRGISITGNGVGVAHDGSDGPTGGWRGERH